ncbi:MAG: TerC family protein, partial [Alphaproteobacteria bacterium]
MAWLTDPDIWLSILTLAVLEIILGIDNLVFISVMSGRLDPVRARRARRLGLIGALFT